MIEISTSRYLYGTAMAFLGLTSCLGYALLWLVLRGRPDLQKKNRFLISLSFSDILIACHSFASAFAMCYGRWPFGDLGCKVDALLAMTCTFVSISNAKWIAKDKYYQSCLPSKAGLGYNFYVKLQWIVGLIGGLLPFVGFGEYGFETDDPAMRTGCMLRFNPPITSKYTFYIITIFLIWFLRPLYVIITSYSKISKASNASCRLLYIVPLQLLLSLTPYAVYAAISIFMGVDRFPHYLVGVNNVAAKIFIASNPFVYIWNDPSLLEQLKKTVLGIDDGKITSRSDQDKKE